MAIINDFKALNARVKEISRHILAPEGEDKLGEECNRLSRDPPTTDTASHTHSLNPPAPQGAGVLGGAKNSRPAKLSPICPDCRGIGWLGIPSPDGRAMWLECKLCGNPMGKPRP